MHFSNYNTTPGELDIQPIVASFVLSEFVYSGLLVSMLLELLQSIYSRCESLSWEWRPVSSYSSSPGDDRLHSKHGKNSPQAAIPGYRLVSTVHALRYNDNCNIVQ